MKTWILFALFFPFTVHACIWDAESLSWEKARSHDLAQVILGQEPAPADETKQLQERIAGLEANRKEADPDWWNNLAGGYLRLGQSQKAVDLLEPVVSKFPDNYGIHANLGTAYHLLGRYADAEKEIARDLEINPDAHFGLEKYHLALLQYLVREAHYQSRHVYVDEFTPALLANNQGWGFDFWYYNNLFGGRSDRYSNNVAAVEQDYQAFLRTNTNERQDLEMLAMVAQADVPPAYREKWELFPNANFEPGVIYMAQMNPKEPACRTMLGIAAWKNRNYHLATTAFEKAIALGSPQAELLKSKVGHLNEFIKHSQAQKLEMDIFIAAILSIILFVIYRSIQSIRRRPATN